jgi:hypothetical protein
MYVFSIIISSCETWDYYTLDEFDFDGAKHAIQVYVDGGISTQKSYHRVTLFKPSDYLTETSTENITTAKVYVTHGNDTMLFSPVTKIWDETSGDSVEVFNPYYQAKVKFGAVVGNVYTLHVEYKGEHYFGSDSVVEAGDFDFPDIPLPIVDNEPNEIINGQQPEYNLEFLKHHFGYPVSNLWIWSTKKSYIDTVDALNSSSYSAIQYSHQFADAQGLFSNIEYSTVLSYEYTKEQDTLIVQRVSLSSGYYKFLNQQFMETDWKEGVFATQPGNLSTNMSTGAMGYFFASDLCSKEIKVEELLEISKTN